MIFTSLLTRNKKKEIKKEEICISHGQNLNFLEQIFNKTVYLPCLVVRRFPIAA